MENKEECQFVLSGDGRKWRAQKRSVTPEWRLGVKMNQEIRERHLAHVIDAMQRYHAEGGALSFHSEDSDGSLVLSFRIDDAAALDRLVVEATASEGVAPAPRTAV
jgi:hypothetical protein